MANRSKKISKQEEIKEAEGSEVDTEVLSEDGSFSGSFSGSEYETESDAEEQDRTKKPATKKASTKKAQAPITKTTKKTPASTKSTKSTKTSGTRAAGKASKGKKTEGKDGKKKHRYFKIIDIKTGKTRGRYTGDTPKQAASKGFTKIVQRLKKKGKTIPKTPTTIYLRESTRGRTKKIYGYEASRQKLEEPQILKITNSKTGEKKKIVYLYRNKIKKIPVPEQANVLKSTKRNSKSKATTSTKKSKKSAPKKSSTSTSTSTPTKKTNTTTKSKGTKAAAK